MKKLTDEYMPKKKEKRTSGVSSWFSWGRSSKVIDQSQPQDKQPVQTSMSDSEIGTGKTVSSVCAGSRGRVQGLEPTFFLDDQCIFWEYIVRTPPFS